MRDYFKALRKGETLCESRLRSNDLHWIAYAALVKGSALFLSWDTICSGMSAYLRRDVTAMLSLSQRLDDQLQMYNDRTSLTRIRAERQIATFLKKFPFTEEESSLDPRAVAVEKLHAAERQCEKTNRRISETPQGELPEWIGAAQSLIEEVLQPLTGRRVMKIISSGSHGPGATLSSNGNRTTTYYKYLDLPYTVTTKAAPYAYAAMSANPRWLDYLESSGRRKELPPIAAPQYQKELMLFKDCCTLVTSDKITFVPKDARTERPIAVGASLNIYLQLGVKTYMEERLKQFGVDLTNQTRNQELARQGSRYAYVGGVENDSQFSTIDMASASDTISIEIVKLLLPNEWFAFLSDLRHESGTLDGEEILYEKFSAMGNGFTFPLESLIFWAVAKAAAKVSGAPSQTKDIAVYGDDLIVRRSASSHVLHALEWAGFLINTEKSFISGYFKESCGADYFRGHNVRPFYLKRRVTTYEDVYFILNSMSLMGVEHRSTPGHVALFQELLSYIPMKKRRYLPMHSTEDCGLRVPFAFITDLGIRPWLYDCEKKHLTSRGLIDSRTDYQSPVYWSESVSALTYKGRARLRLMLALEGAPERLHVHLGKEDALHIQAAMAGQVTRRKATRRVIRILSTPNWDGLYSKLGLKHHPIFWVNV
nr:MAG: hypothetical protein 3 [Leviviridae sp.]